MSGRGAPKKRYTIGAHGSPWTTEQARDHAITILRKVREGVDPNQEKRQVEVSAPTSETMETVSAEFIERYHKANGHRWWREVARMFKHDINPELGAMSIATIQRSDVIRLLDHIVDRGANGQATKTRIVLSKLFAWAIERGYVVTSPVPAASSTARDKKRDRTLSDGELKKVWKAIGMLGWPYGPCIQLLILTGQRRDEVAQLRWDEIDMDKAMWSLPGERTKNKRAHQVPLTPVALTILRDCPRIGDSGLVFTNNGSTPINGFSKVKQKVDLLSGVGSTPKDAWVLHDLRRTAATGMAKMNIPPHIVEKVLNHASGTISGVAAIYNQHGYLEERRQALEAWSNRVLELTADIAVADTI